MRILNDKNNVFSFFILFPNIWPYIIHSEIFFYFYLNLILYFFKIAQRAKRVNFSSNFVTRDSQIISIVYDEFINSN